MAKITLHPSVRSLSGKIDGWVYRQHLGQTIVAAPARTRAPRSPAQQERQKQFAAATDYAREVLTNPLQRKSYQALAARLNKPVNAVLIRNWLTPPEIQDIDLSRLRGRAGDEVRLLAHDDIEVVAVTVTLRTPAGQTLEEGPASCTHGVWHYVLQAPTLSAEPRQLDVTATNRAGRSATASIRIPITQAV